MGEYVLPLDAEEADLATAGGKGASLAKLTRAGLPVPPGFHITTHAYRDRETNPAAVEHAIRDAYQGGPVAVRSSATAEDLPDLSFAGQHDSYLNVTGADEVVAAVKRCWASLHTERAVEYRERNGIDDAHMAVVVQEMVPADAAGVVFTANPDTGATGETVVNAGWGLGESLVSGHVTPDVYVVRNGEEVRRQVNDRPVLTRARTAELAELGERIERLHGTHMDIEWTLHNGRFQIVQARPITNFQERWNDTTLGDFLWTSVNLGEAVPSVMTPMTWSLVRVLSQQVKIGGFPVTGNIGGRFYLNLTVSSSLGTSNTELLGRVPEQITPPKLPVSKVSVITSLLKSAPPLAKQAIAYRRHLDDMLAETPKKCDALRKKIKEATSEGQLEQLWRSDVEDLLLTTARTLDAGARTVAHPKVADQLKELVGEEDAITLLTGLGELASLGPLIGLAELRRGELDRDAFLRTWGHRGPDEFEVSAPRPGEDPRWVDRQLAADPEELLRRQGKTRDEAWQRLKAAHPGKADKIAKQLDKAAETARAREGARSEMVRTFWVFRDFVRRAMELTNNDDLFFLTIDELVDFLTTNRKPDTRSRKAAYERYQALPVYPTFIRGRFDPEAWANDPASRKDFYDESAEQQPESDVIKGFPGMSGVVEGTVRVLSTVDEGLEPGEILVTAVTNVGWTPLFPRAAAVVTDVGAPLSHAAIVARELGIPAVVGCGNATSRLSTGDRVRVDGSRGTVTILT
ncbi:pyruvate, phosphate dikinase [Lentzea tibetensis]|uniref:Pyruvate, phosphate dikinase n=1 Tax=Lentzea tibetensis TaxID=2591470 RepID=A0A563EK72_9PSEU|nr:PEP/pyruvate-binding domain-containing protein [Lentzea tibetensis]TWP46490.1 pyruvate, phosphate dikinase [Lentzea tibetensis]